MSATAAPPRNNPSRKVTGLVVWYLVVGAVGWGIVEIAGWMADPCCPSAPRSAEATMPTRHASGVSPMAVAAGWRILPDRGRKEGE